MHLTAFGMKLEKEQACIGRLRVLISNEDKLQFYMECENICNGYLYVMTQHLLILKGIYGFKFPKRFLEISSRDLTLLSILII